jgi:hypothetical protein
VFFRITTFVFLASLCLACHRVERLDIPTEEQVRHESIQQEQRAHCIERLETIRKELAGLHDHPWAGEYSWFIVRTCGSCPQHAETIALSPEAGAVWWYQGTNLSDALEIDEGEIVSVDDDHIVVHWDLASRSPHINREPRGGLLLDDDLVRVEWGTSNLLIPAVRMARFCGVVSSGQLDSRGAAPRRGGWRWSVGNLEDEPEPTGWPHVPAQWQEYLLRSPIRAVASIEEAPQIFGAHGPMPWKDDSPTLSWRCTALIDAGKASGVRPAMSFIPQEPDSTGSWRSIGVGEVFRVEENKAWIAFSGYTSPKEGPPTVGSHLTVATTAPPPR